jgi:phosphatidylglycerol:prolipoprotein diacylglycerol transferase
MRPVLFELPGLERPVFAYGLLLGLALLVGAVLAASLARLEGMRPREYWRGTAAVVLLALAGGRALDVLTGASGVSAYGALLGAAFGARLAFGRAGFPAAVDRLAPPLALGVALVRIGCFLNGCDFGLPTALPWGVRFPRDRVLAAELGPSPAWLSHQRSGIALDGETVDAPALWSLPVHPTQLYEAGLALVLFAFLLRRWRRGRFEGEVFLCFVVLYGLGRAAIDLVAADRPPGFVSLTQALGLAAALLAGEALRRSLRPGSG